MRRYEMVLVADPTIPEPDHDTLVTSFEELIASEGGTVLKVDRWGRRKLAYPIKKHTEGNYTVLLFDSEPELEKECLRRMKLSGKWLRVLSVRADDQAPPTDEEKDVLVEARKEYLRRAAEREAMVAAGVDPSKVVAPAGSSETAGEAKSEKAQNAGTAAETVEAPAPEKVPVEEAPVEEAPVDEAPVDEAPVEEAPVEEAPVEEAAVEEAPVEEAPVEEVPATEEAVTEDAPADEPAEAADAGEEKK